TRRNRTSPQMAFLRSLCYRAFTISTRPFLTENMDDKIIIRGDNKLNLLNFTHQFTVEGYITFLIQVKSGSFSGESSFCISAEILKNSIFVLEEIYNLLTGSCTINDYDSDDFITFEMQKNGHMIVRGQVGGSHNSQYLIYELQSDQTLLKVAINELNCLLKA
ncbi:MAG: WapI family immunity protein, partial [Saccharofermentanales bacterium]